MVRARVHKILVAPEVLIDLVTCDLVGPEKDEVVQRIDATVDSLPEPERSCIELQVWQQLTVQEIADELGLHRQTVRGRLRRGRAMLREQLSDLY